VAFIVFQGGDKLVVSGATGGSDDRPTDVCDSSIAFAWQAVPSGAWN